MKRTSKAIWCVCILGGVLITQLAVRAGGHNNMNACDQAYERWVAACSAFDRAGGAEVKWEINPYTRGAEWGTLVKAYSNDRGALLTRIKRYLCEGPSSKYDQFLYKVLVQVYAIDEVSVIAGLTDSMRREVSSDPQRYTEVILGRVPIDEADRATLLPKPPAPKP